MPAALPRIAIVLVALCVAGGCATRVLFEPTRSSTVVAPAEVAVGDTLYPFRGQGRWGYVGPSGATVIEPQFQGAGVFSEGRAAVQVNGAWGYVDTSGQLVVPARYGSAAAFSQGRGVVQTLGEREPRYGYVDPAGVEVVPTVLPQAYSYSEGRALVQFYETPPTAVERLIGMRGAFRGFLDRDGELAFQTDGEGASFSEGLAPFTLRRRVFSLGDRWGYRRPDGSVAVSPDLGTAFLFTDGLARVVRDGRIGYIGPDGEPAFGQTFDIGLQFSEDRAPVQIDGRWGFIDRSGATVIGPQYDQAQGFSGGLAAVQRGALWGYIGPDGQEILAHAYTSAATFRGPLALVADATGSYYINRQGQLVRRFTP